MKLHNCEIGFYLYQNLIFEIYLNEYDIKHLDIYEFNGNNYDFNGDTYLLSKCMNIEVQPVKVKRLTDIQITIDKSIKKLTEELKNLINDLNEELLFEMVDVVKSQTNLPVIVWVDGNFSGRPHANRIKFNNSYSDKLYSSELIPLKLDSLEIPDKLKSKVKIKEKDLNKVIEWVKLNKKVIEDYGKGLLSTKEFFNQIKPI